MARLQQLLEDEPDQAAWEFQARLLLKAEQEPPEGSDNSEAGDLEGNMSEDRLESGDDSDAGSPLKRKPERGGQGKGYKLRRGTHGRGSGWRSRTVSPGHPRQTPADSDGAAAFCGFAAVPPRQ